MNPFRAITGPLRPLARWVMQVRRQRRRRRRYRRTFAANDLLRPTPGRHRYLQEVREYWRAHYGKAVHPFWHVICANVTGIEDVRYIPTDVWFDEILPFFNRMAMREAYIDKNFAELLLGDINAPGTILRRIHGEYHDDAHRWLTRDEARAALLAGSTELIIKPSLTDNGVGIRRIEVRDGGLRQSGAAIALEALERSHGADFVVQARIRQHAAMAAPHPDSVNTVRLVTFRWNGGIRVLLAFARFGTGGNLTDNAGTGGVCCGISEDGELRGAAVDEHGTMHERHPTTGYDFGTGGRVPGYEAMCQRALALHRRIHHFDIVSWDFAVGEDAEPICVEFNVRGAVFIYQFACARPLFGELTGAVLELVRDSGGTRFAEGLATGGPGTEAE